MSDPSPTDDPSIREDEVLWRRVHPTQFPQPGVDRPKSNAFDDHSEGAMSVHLAQVAEQHGLGPEDLLADFPGFAMVGITAAAVRELGLIIQRKPEQHDPTHAEVYGKKTKSVRKRLAISSCWIVRPPSRRREPGPDASHRQAPGSSGRS